MANPPRRPSFAENNTPSFFAIILDGAIRTNKIRIPEATVKRCGSSLKDEVVLKVPGSEWKMIVTRTMVRGVRHVYIDDGWVEFSRHFSIAKGHLLDFRYVGDSRFDVTIFDITTNEIEYPVKQQTESQTGNHINPNIVVKEEDVSDSSLPPVVRPSVQSRPPKRKRKGEQAAGYVDGYEPSEESAGSSKRLNTKKARRAPVSRARKGKLKEKQAMRANDGHGHRESSETDPRVSLEAVEQARKRAKSFVESTHPSFLQVLLDCHFGAPGYMSIPRKFAELYLRRSKKVVLIAPDKTKNPVKFSYKGGNHRAGFRSGWVAFARKNDLTVGDVCVFALTKSAETAFIEVSFFLKNGDTNTHSAKDSGTKQNSSAVDEQTENLSSAEEQEPGTKQKSSPVNEQVEISSSTEEQEPEEDDSDDSFSPVVRPSARYLPQKRKLKETKQKSSAVDERTENPSSAEEQEPARVKKSSAVNEQSENPSFAVYIHRTYLNRCSCSRLRVPARFAKKYLKTNPSEICLRDSRGNSRLIEYKVSRGKFGGASETRYLISKGWSDFRKKIGVKEGDICAFELTNQNDFLFNVRVVEPTHPDYKQLHTALGRKRTKPIIAISEKDDESEPLKPTHPDYEQNHTARGPKRTKPVYAIPGKDAET